MMAFKSSRLSIDSEIFIAFCYPIPTVLYATNEIGLTCNCLSFDGVRPASR